MEQAINNFVSVYLQLLVYGLGGIVILIVAYLFALDFLRTRAREQRKIWRNL